MYTWSIQASPEQQPELCHLDGHQACAHIDQLPQASSGRHSAATQRTGSCSGARAKGAGRLPAAHVWSRLDGPGHQLPHAEPPLEEMVATSLSTTWWCLLTTRMLWRRTSISPTPVADLLRLSGGPGKWSCWRHKNRQSPALTTTGITEADRVEQNYRNWSRDNWSRWNVVKTKK